MKKIFQLLKPAGLQEVWLALLAWFTFFLVDIVILGSLYFWFHGTIGHSATAGGAYRIWLPTLFHDLAVNYPGSASVLQLYGLIAVVLMFTLSLFINGGYYDFLKNEASFKPLELLKKSSRLFGAMLRLALLFLPIWLLLTAAPGILFKFQAAGQKTSPSESMFYLFMVLWIPLTLFMVMVGKSSFDYARIYLTDESTGVTASLKLGMKALWSNRLYTFLLFSFYILYTAGVLFVFSLFGEDLPWLAIFFIHQFFILCRYYGRVLLMKGETILIKETENRE